MRTNLTITVTLSQELLRKVNRSAKAEDLNRSQYIRKIIRAYQIAQQTDPGNDPPSSKSGRIPHPK
jgi:metal-responsive CopG/Arc/MetJ family transcriptional regulator